MNPPIANYTSVLMDEFVGSIVAACDWPEPQKTQGVEALLRSALQSYAAHLVGVLPKNSNFKCMCRFSYGGCGCIIDVQNETKEDCRSAIQREAGINEG